MNERHLNAFWRVFCIGIVIILSFVVSCAVEQLNSLKSDITELEIKIEENEEMINFVYEKIDTEENKLEYNPQTITKSLGEFKLTAYCSCEKCCGKWALNRPKDENGKDIVYGSTGEVLIAGRSIAVDPKVIPYGSQVEIGGRTYTAQDCGGAIKGNRIDVYFDSHQDALEFGVQHAEVFLIVSTEENQ